MDRAKRLAWFRPRLVQSHAFLSEAASTRRNQKSLDEHQKTLEGEAVYSAAFESTQVLVVGKNQGYWDLRAQVSQ